MEKKAKCAAKTKEGKQCKNSASGKSKFCAAHKKKQFVNCKIISQENSQRTDLNIDSVWHLHANGKFLFILPLHVYQPLVADTLIFLRLLLVIANTCKARGFARNCILYHHNFS